MSNNSNFNSDLFWPLFVTATVTSLGWFVYHWFAANRDREKMREEIKYNQQIKRRDEQLKYLTEAYRVLSDSCERNNFSYRDVEKAFSDIMLYGSKEQISICKRFMEILSVNTMDAMLGEVLTSLRNSLRRDLGLLEAEDHFSVFRFYNNKLGAGPNQNERRKKDTPVGGGRIHQGETVRFYHHANNKDDIEAANLELANEL